MMDFREIILARLDALGWSVRQLAERSDLSCHPQTIYRYLRGGRGLKDTILAEVFDAIGLRVAVTKRPRKRKEPKHE